MAEQNITLYDLLNLSISAPGQGTVNFRAMSTLLHGILRQLDIREVTVSWSETFPGDSSSSSREPQGQQDGGHGQKKLEPGRGAPQETAPSPESESAAAGGQGTPREDGLDKESREDVRQILELIQRTQEQTDCLQDNMKDLRHQQEKAAGVQSQWVKALEVCSHKVDALEEAMRCPETDDLSRYVTWEAMKSALISERENLQKGLSQAKDTNKEIKVNNTTKTDQDTSNNAPPKAQTHGDLSTEAEMTKDKAVCSEKVPPLKTLSQKVCGSSLYPETVEALRNIGRLKQRCDGLEARISALEQERSREYEELLQLRELLHNKGSQDVFDAVKEELDEQKALVRNLLSERDKNSQLVSGVQKAVLHLQAECEKLHETTRCLHEDNQQKQTHIEELYKTTEGLEEKKADKNMVETEIRADKSALEGKVSRVQFDSVTEQLSNMFSELLNKVTDQEQDWNKLMEKLSAEMDCKLNRIELDSVKKQLEARWKSIQERMKNQGALEQDDAAGIRKQLVERFHCLSCDRPVMKHIPGPHLLTLPASPGLQPHRSMRPFTVYTLEQIRQHYRSSRKREQLQKSYNAMCRQIDRLREDQRGEYSQNQNQYQSQYQSQLERIMEVADYSLYSVSRSCGGSHTVTSYNQRRSGLQHNRHLGQYEDTVGQSEEVDIVGQDGHIYKGRLNASPSRNAETKLPTIATKDGSSKSRDRSRSSLSPRVSPEGPAGLHPPSTRTPSCPSASCSSGRDWPVSALGCTSQSSMVPMSVNAAGGSPESRPEQAF